MPRRLIARGAEQWEVAVSGRRTQYTKDEFSLVFTRIAGGPVERRLVRYSPMGPKSRELSLARLDDMELRELLGRSQPSLDGAGNRVPPLSEAANGGATQRYVDLHVHTTASDGERAPADVVARAARAGLVAIAITDHDTIAGVAEAEAAGAALGVRVVAGCEFSVDGGWGEMHLLGYFLPVTSPELATFLADARADRERRARTMVEKLVAAGVQIDDDMVLTAAAGGAVGRPHVARALLDMGAVRSLDEAFDRYLGRGRAAYVDKRLPAFRDVTALVHRLGGVVSAAHLKDRGSKGNLERLRAGGLDAVETRHPSHDPDTRARLTDLVLKLGLGRSGGSDWHGEPEGGWSHGALGSQQVPYEWLEALEARRPAVAPC